MHLNTNIILILLGGIIILSYFFTIISNKTRIPSVLLLIATGMIIRYAANRYHLPEQEVQPLVKVLGSAGLIMIILEAALDLEVHRYKLKFIRNSFFAAITIFVISAASISAIIAWWLKMPLSSVVIYAIPLSIISSAIIIPSTSHLPEQKKEFIIYESSFSDIVGILAFNYLAMHNIMTMESSVLFLGRIGLAIVISAVASLLLIYMLSRISGVLKFFLVFAILAIVYASGELIHLPSLLIILVFGSLLNNSHIIIRGFVKNIIPVENIHSILGLMKTITAESSFLIRTFFFILFGYTINPYSLAEPGVVELGSFIVLALLLARVVYLRIFLKSNVFPEVLLMPRGLITILLIYKIPDARKLMSFNEGVILYVIVVTSLLMMIGLILYNGKPPQEPGQ